MVGLRSLIQVRRPPRRQSEAVTSSFIFNNNTETASCPSQRRAQSTEQTALIALLFGSFARSLGGSCRGHTIAYIARMHHAACALPYSPRTPVSIAANVPVLLPLSTTLVDSAQWLLLMVLFFLLLASWCCCRYLRYHGCLQERSKEEAATDKLVDQRCLQVIGGVRPRDHNRV